MCIYWLEYDVVSEARKIVRGQIVKAFSLIAKEFGYFSGDDGKIKNLDHWAASEEDGLERVCI